MRSIPLVQLFLANASMSETFGHIGILLMVGGVALASVPLCDWLVNRRCNWKDRESTFGFKMYAVLSGLAFIAVGLWIYTSAAE